MTHLTKTPLDSYDLPPAVRDGIASAGFENATPIQEKVLPLALAGRDVAGQAQTGTGKTAAFLISGMTRLLRGWPETHPRGPRMLVVAPTRELAIQIAADAETLGRFTGLAVAVVFGGMDMRRQRETLRRHPDLLIGTPGRLLDFEQQRATTFAHVEVLVIDEADRMFDMGFIRDLRRILRRCPPYDRRQSMLFSATLTPRVMELAWEHMNDPVKVEVAPEQVTAAGIHETLYHVPSKEKLPLFLGLLAKERWEKTLIFVNRKDTAAHLSHALAQANYPVAVLAGNVAQEKRLRILEDFKSGRWPAIIATDVASRGLHIEGVTHVINYDLPQDAEDYVHRVGRTARAGAEGAAISFADEEYVFSLDAIEKLIGRRIPAQVADPALYREAPRIAPERRGGGARPRRGGPGSGPRGGTRPGAQGGAPASPAAPAVTYGRRNRKPRR